MKQSFVPESADVPNKCAVAIKQHDHSPLRVRYIDLVISVDCDCHGFVKPVAGTRRDAKRLVAVQDMDCSDAWIRDYDPSLRVNGHMLRCNQDLFPPVNQRQETVTNIRKEDTTPHTFCCPRWRLVVLDHSLHGVQVDEVRHFARPDLRSGPISCLR